MKEKCILENNKGAVLVTAMFVLVLLTLMGKSITTLSNNEMKIAGNERFEKKTFFASEAGFGHIKAMLQSEFTNRNQAKIASGQSPDWDFALNGTVEGVISHIVDRIGQPARKILLDQTGNLDLAIQVMINDEGFLPRNEYPQRILKDGDSVKFMLLVGGG